MNRALRFYWHRFREWRHRVLAERAGDRFAHHCDRADAHETAANRILCPPGTGPPPEVSPVVRYSVPTHDDGPQIR